MNAQAKPVNSGAILKLAAAGVVLIAVFGLGWLTAATGRGQEADHPEVPEAVRQVEADVAVRNRAGDRVENRVLLVGVLAEGNEAWRDETANRPTHERRDLIQYRLSDRGLCLRI